jgi:hypothetical protein
VVFPCFVPFHVTTYLMSAVYRLHVTRVCKLSYGRVIAGLDAGGAKGGGTAGPHHFGDGCTTSHDCETEHGVSRGWTAH